MKNFILLLHENAEEVKGYSPEKMQELVEGHMKWAQQLQEAGHMLGGAGLGTEGVRIVGKNALIKDGPYIESKELIGGYYIIAARDFEHATEIAQGCPCHKWGGTTEIRYQMNPDDYQ